MPLSWSCRPCLQEVFYDLCFRPHLSLLVCTTDHNICIIPSSKLLGATISLGTKVWQTLLALKRLFLTPSALGSRFALAVFSVNTIINESLTKTSHFLILGCKPCSRPKQLLKDARSYFSKFNSLFHLKNHRSKDVNFNFSWNGQAVWIYKAIMYMACSCLYLTV